MLKQILLATLIFVFCVIGYNIYKHQMTKRAFKQARQDEFLVLVHKGGDEKFPVKNIPRNYPTFFGVCFGRLDEKKHVSVVGDIYNITLAEEKDNVPAISYYETYQEAVNDFFKAYEEAGGKLVYE